jgi:hypothetical protein
VPAPAEPRRWTRAVWRAIAYLAVWLLVGSFFVACAYFAESSASWRREERPVWGFLQTYALALTGGCAIQILAALLLRLLTRAARLNGVIHWLGFGAALGIAVPWAVARAAYLLEGLRFPHEWQTAKSVLMFPLMGAMMYEVRSAWVLLAVGAATGGTVRLMMRNLARPHA